MKIIIYAMAITMWLLSTAQFRAQDKETAEQQIEILNASIEQIEQEEKDALKNEVMSINRRLENKEITADEADTLKRTAAERRALNIENRVAIVNNKIAFIERNGMPTGTINKIEINVFTEGQLVDVEYTSRKRKYDRRTTSDFVFAFGLSNAIGDGHSLSDSDFEVGGSRFAEFGWAWKTRVFKESNWLRFKYGFSFVQSGLKPTDNRYFVDTGSETELQVSEFDLDKSKLRIDNLVFPVHFEFGPSRKKEGENYFRYSTRKKIKVGLGGYAGFRLGTLQKLKYDEAGEDLKIKQRSNLNVSDFVYGLSGYIGWAGAALYVRYDLNPVFKNNTTDLHNISMGLRFDMD